MMHAPRSVIRFKFFKTISRNIVYNRNVVVSGRLIVRGRDGLAHDLIDAGDAIIVLDHAYSHCLVWLQKHWCPCM